MKLQLYQLAFAFTTKGEGKVVCNDCKEKRRQKNLLAHSFIVWSNWSGSWGRGGRRCDNLRSSTPTSVISPFTLTLNISTLYMR